MWTEEKEDYVKFTYPFQSGFLIKTFSTMKHDNDNYFGIWQKLTKIICCGFLFSLSGCGGSKGDVPLFETPEWKMNPEYEVGLSLRREDSSQNNSGLLIKHDTRQPFVRRYNQILKNVEVVPPEMWDKSNAPIARCSEQFAPDTKFLKINPKTKQLMDGKDNIIPTEGNTILNLTISPQNNRVAVLSASGTAGGDYSVIPFGSGSGASGQYWLQVYSLKTRQFESSPVRIPTQEKFTSLHACWSSDEKFVIYAEVTYRFFVVVEVD